MTNASSRYVVELEIVHTTSKKFGKFRKDRPTFFFPLTSREEIVAIRGNIAFDGTKPRSISAKFSGQIVNAENALKFWNFANPRNKEDGYTYSMLCYETNEFPKSQIKRFVQALRDAGIGAVEYLDYSQVDFQEDALAIAVVDTKCLIVCDPEYVPLVQSSALV
jgi:hypothetical protein